MVWWLAVGQLAWLCNNFPWQKMLSGTLFPASTQSRSLSEGRASRQDAVLLLRYPSGRSSRSIPALNLLQHGPFFSGQQPRSLLTGPLPPCQTKKVPPYLLSRAEGVLHHTPIDRSEGVCPAGGEVGRTYPVWPVKGGRLYPLCPTDKVWNIHCHTFPGDEGRYENTDLLGKARIFLC